MCGSAPFVHMHFMYFVSAEDSVGLRHREITIENSIDNKSSEAGSCKECIKPTEGGGRSINCSGCLKISRKRFRLVPRLFVQFCSSRWE